MFNPFQALVFGDNRPFNVALVFPDWNLVRSWAESKGRANDGTSTEELASMDVVKNLIAGEIALSLEGFKKYEVCVGSSLVRSEKCPRFGWSETASIRSTNVSNGVQGAQQYP